MSMKFKFRIVRHFGSIHIIADIFWSDQCLIEVDEKFIDVQVDARRNSDTVMTKCGSVYGRMKRQLTNSDIVVQMNNLSERWLNYAFAHSFVDRECSHAIQSWKLWWQNVWYLKRTLVYNYIYTHRNILSFPLCALFLCFSTSLALSLSFPLLSAYYKQSGRSPKVVAFFLLQT